MADELDDLGSEVDEHGNETAPKLGIDPKVLETAEKAGAAKLYAQIVSDPEVGKILQARAAGKKVRVIGDDESGNANVVTAPEVEPDFDTMSEKQRHQYLINQITKETKKLVDQQLAPVSQRLDTLDGYAQGQIRKDATNQVETLRKEFKDFDKLAPRMQELAGEHPKLNAKQVYTLAAQEAGVLTRSEHRTTSERPTNNTARPAKKKELVGKATFGGLREIIAAAANRTVSTLQPQYDNDDE